MAFVILLYVETALLRKAELPQILYGSTESFQAATHKDCESLPRFSVLLSFMKEGAAL